MRNGPVQCIFNWRRNAVTARLSWPSMAVTNARLLLAGATSAVGLSLLIGVAAPPAHAGDTKIICSAVKVRKEPETSTTAVGVAYRGDSVEYDQWAYNKKEKRWYTRGTITRRSDGVRIRGYVPYDCANPYKDNSNPPTPQIPE